MVLGLLALIIASSLSDYHYSHQCNHHPAGAPVCVFCIVYFKSCHSLAVSALCVNTSKGCNPVLHLQPLRTNSNCLCFAYMFFAWCRPGMHTAVVDLLDSIQTQLRLCVHMTCMYKPAFNIHGSLRSCITAKKNVI